MNIDYKSLGKRVRSYRKKMTLTQAELAEISGVQPSNLSHIERATTKVSLPTLVKITNALEITTDDLLYDSLEKNAQISIKELNEVLSDCNDSEIKIIVEMVKSMKLNIRKNTFR